MKKILISVFVIILLFFEIIRENNYLEKSYITVPKYFNNSIKDFGILEVDGNWYSQSFNKNDTFSSPRVSNFKCYIDEKVCKEATFYGGLLGINVLNEFEYNITHVDKNQIKATRTGTQKEFNITFNLTNEEVTIEEHPVTEKTGNKLLDIGLYSVNSKLVDAQEILKLNKKYHTDFINTPILKIFMR